MSSVNIDRLNAAELFQLMHFYADAGVDCLLEEEPVDRFGEFKALEERRNAANPRNMVVKEGRSPAVLPQGAPAGPERNQQTEQYRRAIAIPDSDAVALAQSKANEATSVAELIETVRAFTGCNLRNSARTTAFFSGNVAASILVVGGVPGADDDRHGQPFAGSCGEMLERMLSWSGIPKDDIGVFNLIPWRPPGNRAPTPHELEVCRPFGLRLLELVQPRKMLILGNLPIRFLTGSNENIHSCRGRWQNITVAEKQIAAMATFHPSDLFAAPACKKVCWQDLLMFQNR